ncbi:MAG: thioredoxin family protein [Candidatus Hydrogenedentota bacterium]
MAASSIAWVVFAKRDCPTCTMIEPVLQALDNESRPITVYVQDDPSFPEQVSSVIDDTSLKQSYLQEIETVPTLIRIENDSETQRIVGWNKEEWRAFTDIESLGEELPAHRPGCGSKNVEPGVAEKLAILFGEVAFGSRPIELAVLEDEMEACYDRGWSDGLPVVPPTRERVLSMLGGTTRDPAEIVGTVPPDLIECTVEKIAINAVLAGCKPEYMPVVLAAVEAALIDDFCMHGLLATTWFSGPIVIVNGPITKRIGMNSGANALGQGNRANATIGRALQLVIRNVGGGKPQGVDRATLGNPGKYTFCFAEDESDDRWNTLHEERGFDKSKSTVTLFAGDGVQGIMDQQSREPESLIATFAECLKTVAHPKIAMAADAMLVVTPEHSRVFYEAGWDKQKFREALEFKTMRPGADLIRGANDIAEGLPEHLKDVTVPKFRPGGLHIVRAGGKAGMFSAIIGGWVASGPIGSQAVTKEIST